MACTLKGDISSVKKVLEIGVNVNNKDNFGMTCLMHAAKLGYKEITELLLSHGAIINICNTSSYNALMIAARYGNHDITKLLIDNGAEIDYADTFGWTALMIATRYNHEDIIKLLLENGADVNKIESRKYTALMLAAKNKNLKVLLALIKHGADIPNDSVDIINSLEKISWWDKLNTNIIKNNLSYIKEIVKPESITNNSIIIAIVCGKVEILDALLEKHRMNDIHSYLRYAVFSQRYNSAKYLLNLGANPFNRNPLGLNSLHIACHKGNVSLVKLILKHEKKIIERSVKSIQNFFKQSMFHKRKQGIIEIKEQPSKKQKLVTF